MINENKQNDIFTLYFKTKVKPILFFKLQVIDMFRAS